MVCPDFRTKDEIYCKSLAKALYYVDSPVTVGFYAPWGRRKDYLLNKIESYLCVRGKNDQEKRKRTEPKTRQTNGTDLIKLIFLMIFYHPVITETHKQRKNIRYCFIRFSAWEYAGCDQLWAGMVTTLCDGIENCFGLAPISIYRAVGGKTIIDSPHEQEWVSKKILCIPYWVATLLVIIIGIAVGALMLIFGFPMGDLTGVMLTAAEGVGASLVGISAAGAIRIAIVVMRNAVVTQKGKVEQKMNRTDMSSQLGFMSDVKSEVNIITSYLQFLEVFQRQKIRVVLEITNLDKCMPDKVVGVLNAMNILLSDPNAPFISILAVDPQIIVECVESSTLLKGMANNGYQFLNRIITLPFCMPRMDCETKIFLLRSTIERKRELTSDQTTIDTSISNEIYEQNIPNVTSNYFPLEVRSSNDSLETRNCFLEERLKDEAFEHLLKETIRGYIPDNVVHLRRLVNTIPITIRLMIRELPRIQIKPCKVAEWVLLAIQWPCRLSWILQCIEDEQQRKFTKEQIPNNSKYSSYIRNSLCDVFEKSLEELDAIKANIQRLLELDGDPEIFEKLLNNFTVEDANFFLPFTVNLDASVKRQMELLRGSNNMWEAKKSNRLAMLSVIHMTVCEVCDEMNKLGFAREKLHKYKQKIIEHNLNGRALVYSDNNSIKEVMGMGLGDWTLFSMYFLGVLPATPLISK